LNFSELNSPNYENCEKNWVFLPREGNVWNMIYKWFPLQIGHLENEDFVIDRDIEMPKIFKLARGSTNGFLFNNEIWFVVHFVHHNNGNLREYYHMIVVLDSETHELLKYTVLFKFTIDTPIEYCLGIVVEQDKVILSHSVRDEESYIKVYNKEYIETMFI